MSTLGESNGLKTTISDVLWSAETI